MLKQCAEQVSILVLALVGPRKYTVITDIVDDGVICFHVFFREMRLVYMYNNGCVNTKLAFSAYAY